MRTSSRSADQVSRQAVSCSTTSANILYVSSRVAHAFSPFVNKRSGRSNLRCDDIAEPVEEGDVGPGAQLQMDRRGAATSVRRGSMTMSGTP